MESCVVTNKEEEGEESHTDTDNRPHGGGVCDGRNLSNHNRTMKKKSRDNTNPPSHRLINPRPA